MRSFTASLSFASDSSPSDFGKLLVDSQGAGRFDAGHRHFKHRLFVGEFRLEIVLREGQSDGARFTDSSADKLLFEARQKGV